MSVKRRIRAVAWVLLVVVVTLDPFYLIPGSAGCAGPSPAVLTGAGATAAAGTVRWRMAVECGGASASPWFTTEDAGALKSDVFLTRDLLVVAPPGHGVVTGYDLLTGRRRWTYDVGDPSFHMWGSASAQWVMIRSWPRAGRMGRYQVLDARTGQLRWSQPSPLGYSEGLDILGDRLVLQQDYSELVGLDPQTGHELWRVARPRNYRSDHFDDSFAYIDLWQGKVGARTLDSIERIDLRTGEVSTQPLAEPVAGFLEMVHPAGVLVFERWEAGRYEQGTTAVDTETGRVLWQRPAGLPGYVKSNGLAMRPSGYKGPVMVVDPRSGEVQWQAPPRRSSYYEWYHDEGYLLQGESADDGKGTLVAVNPDSTIRWQTQSLPRPRAVWQTTDTLVVSTCPTRYSRCNVRQLVAIAIS
ncbi:PQQ-binding-like beta-propeller repeat protein [Micromonospora luteifusca]|uniref:outer membrane protein assembly factor BamB family protein n=1 Tax=Micromonospora luteifusca TaxID=709860 RepID=UPI0033BB5DE8